MRSAYVLAGLLFIDSVYSLTVQSWTQTNRVNGRKEIIRMQSIRTRREAKSFFIYASPNIRKCLYGLSGGRFFLELRAFIRWWIKWISPIQRSRKERHSYFSAIFSTQNYVFWWKRSVTYLCRSIAFNADIYRVFATWSVGRLLQGGVPGRHWLLSKYGPFRDIGRISHQLSHQKPATAGDFGHFLTSLAPHSFI